MTDLEHRLWSLEIRFAALPIATIESRLAAVEQGAWQQSQDGGGVPATFTAIRCARTTSAITAKAGAQAGTGTATASDIDPTSGTPGAITTAENLPIYNWYGVVIPTATDVILGWAPDLALGGTVGVWVVVSQYCP